MLFHKSYGKTLKGYDGNYGNLELRTYIFVPKIMIFRKESNFITKFNYLLPQ